MMTHDMFEKTKGSAKRSILSDRKRSAQINEIAERVQMQKQ